MTQAEFESYAKDMLQKLEELKTKILNTEPAQPENDTSLIDAVDNLRSELNISVEGISDDDIESIWDHSWSEPESDHAPDILVFLINHHITFINKLLATIKQR